MLFTVALRVREIKWTGSESRLSPKRYRVFTYFKERLEPYFGKAKQNKNGGLKMAYACLNLEQLLFLCQDNLLIIWVQVESADTI